MRSAEQSSGLHRACEVDSFVATLILRVDETCDDREDFLILTPKAVRFFSLAGFHSQFG